MCDVGPEKSPKRTPRRPECWHTSWRRSSLGTSFSLLIWREIRQCSLIVTQATPISPVCLCNLVDGAPGGTWIEDPSGTVPRQCADGKVRDGKIVRGFRYRFSANKLWHAPELDVTCRTVLVGWVPAGWAHMSPPDMCTLGQLGFQMPAAEREGACALSLWSGSAVVQTRMERFMVCSSDHVWKRREPWVKGRLRDSPRELHICLSSDSESSAVEMVLEPVV